MWSSCSGFGYWCCCLLVVWMITGDQKKSESSMILVTVNVTLNHCSWVDTEGFVHISSHSYSALCVPTCVVIYCVATVCKFLDKSFTGKQMLRHYFTREKDVLLSHFLIILCCFFFKMKGKSSETLCVVLSEVGKEKLHSICTGIILSGFPYYLSNTELSTYFANFMQFRKDLETKASKKNLIAWGARPVK